MANKTTTKDIPAAVREVCLWLPEAQEKKSHGMPTFHVRNKNFAIFSVNHHGSGRVALWLNVPDGAQAFYCDAEPEHYFRPPYVGPRGWLGLVLDQGLAWTQIADLVRQAYEKSAPAGLVQKIGKTINIEPPDRTMDPQDLDSMNTAASQATLKILRGLCVALPEVTESRRFGRPAWKAGTKTFCAVTTRAKRLMLDTWVGPDLQATLTDDPRFQIPAFTGQNGWIRLDIEDTVNWKEVEALIIGSYEHFALKRMLNVLRSGTS